MPDTTARANLASRPWVPEGCESYIQTLANETARRSADETADVLEGLITENRLIHEDDCFNLNPGTNGMNPKAEAAMVAGLGSRTSLASRGDKYKMGREEHETLELEPVGDIVPVYTLFKAGVK